MIEDFEGLNRDVEQAETDQLNELAERPLAAEQSSEEKEVQAVPDDANRMPGGAYVSIFTKSGSLAPVTQSEAMKETSEFVEWLGDLAAVTVRALRDGKFSVSEAADYFPALLEAKDALTGLGALKSEAAAYDGPQVAELFRRQREKLIMTGVKPVLVDAFITNLQGFYTVFAATAQSGEPLAE